ncbi:MAG: radical SAM protein [Bacilli bacterium]
MEELFNKCNLCPRECSVNRNNKELGYCRASNKLKIGGYHLHMWEEPIISGKNGSGTIFFSYCNLRCIYCQNYDISIYDNGEEITIDRFANICLELQDMGAENINLVTPSHYIPLIRDGLIMAKNKGLNIPIVYNTSGYEKVDSLRLLDGLIDIYLPDFKYYDDNLGKYSNVNNYFEIADKAIQEMYRQVGSPIIKKGIMRRGIIVRHLVLPHHSDDSKKVVKYLYDKYGENIYLSIMNQYTPARRCKYLELNDRVSEKEYNNLIDYTYDIGIRKCFVQDSESQSESFIPVFKGDSFI